MRPAGYLVYIAIAVVVTTAGPLAVQADSNGASAPATIINLELKDTPIKDAIGALFQGTGTKYYIQPGVSGKVVELKLKGVTIDQAMGALAEAAGLVFKVEDGCYVIGPAPTSYMARQPQAVPEPPAQQVAPPVAQMGAGPAPQTSAQTMPERLPPIEQRIEGGSANVSITQAPPASYGGYGCGGCGGWGGYYQIGNVGVIGGWPGVAVIGGNPYMLQTMQPPPPPPDWVGPDLLRFLRTQYVIRARPGITYPYYCNSGCGYGYGY